MQLSQDANNKVHIDRVESGLLIINGVHYHENLLITPQHDVLTWAINALDNLTWDDCESLLIHEPEIIIIGTGSRQQSIAPLLRYELTKRQIGIETMNTQAACYTYTILAADQRRVLAGLILE